MHKGLIIKSFKLRASSNDNISKIIVVGFKHTRVNGRYIEKVGVCTKQRGCLVYYFKLNRIAFWLNRGAKMKTRIFWAIGHLQYGEYKE